MPQVSFKGPVSNEDGTQQVEVDDVVLPKDSKPIEISDAQLKRLLDLPGLRFEVDGKEKVTEVATPPAAEDTATPADAESAEEASARGDGRKGK